MTQVVSPAHSFALPDNFHLPNPLWALTLRQPWPQMFLLDEDPKRLENRMWMPPREQLVPGDWFILHGGGPPKAEKDFTEVRDALDWVNLNVWDMAADPDEWAYSEDILAACVTGLFGLAKLKSVTTSRGQRWRSNDRYAWLIGDFIPLPAPVVCRGFKDLWEVQGEALSRLRQVLGLDPAPLSLPAEAPATPTPPANATQYPAGLFTPGVVVANLPARPETGRMYGLRAGDDWVTVICQRDAKTGTETYSWCARRSEAADSGNRHGFEAFLKHLRQVAA